MADQITPDQLEPAASRLRADLPPITYLSPADMTPEIQRRRAEDMRDMYYHPEQPMSMAEIGVIYGLTRERVRQIFKQYDIPVRPRPEARAIVNARRQRS